MKMSKGVDHWEREPVGNGVGAPTYEHTCLGDLYIYSEPPWPFSRVLKKEAQGRALQVSQLRLAGVQAHSEDRALLQVLSLLS